MEKFVCLREETRVGSKKISEKKISQALGETLSVNFFYGRHPTLKAKSLTRLTFAGLGAWSL